MSSPLGNKQNVTVFVLYLMQNVGYPMDFATVNDIVMQTDYVAYLDFVESFARMEDGGLIARVGTTDYGEPTYAVTDKGSTVVESLRSEILPSILEESLTCALRYLDLQRRHVVVDCTSQRLSDKTYDVTFYLREKDKTILTATINVDSEYRSRQMRENFRDRPDVIYRGLIALLTGKVDYLFDK